MLLTIVLHGWGNTVQSYLILSHPTLAAQPFYVLLPWAIAIYLSRRYGDDDVAALPRPRWWPGAVEPEQRGEPDSATLPA